MTFTDRNGHTACEADTFRFTPPDWWYTPDTPEYFSTQYLKGRLVRIREVHTHTAKSTTVALKSDDPVMLAYLRGLGNGYYPTDWLTVVD